MRYIRAEQLPELSDMHIIRGPAELDAGMPPYVIAFLEEEWRKETGKTH
jgi:hypothetical protein